MIHFGAGRARAAIFDAIILYLFTAFVMVIGPAFSAAENDNGLRRWVIWLLARLEQPVVFSLHLASATKLVTNYKVKIAEKDHGGYIWQPSFEQLSEKYFGYGL